LQKVGLKEEKEHKMGKVKYISKVGEWFKEGTEAFREEPTYEGHAIYKGVYVVGSSGGGYDNFWYNKGHKDGDEVEMREHCSDDEFDIK